MVAKSGGAPQAPPKQGEPALPPWKFTVKKETGAQAEWEAKQRQEQRESLVARREEVLAEWLVEAVRLEDNVAEIAKALVRVGATTVLDVAYVTPE